MVSHLCKLLEWLIDQSFQTNTVSFKCWKQLKNKRHTQWDSLNFQLQVFITWTVVLCCWCNFLLLSVLELAITHFRLLWAGTSKSCFTSLTCVTFVWYLLRNNEGRNLIVLITNWLDREKCFWIPWLLLVHCMNLKLLTTFLKISYTEVSKSYRIGHEGE